MRNKVTVLWLILALTLTMAVPAQAVVLNFDDIATPNVFTTMPSPYGGFNWEGSWVWVGNNEYTIYTAPSPPNFLDVGGWGDRAVTISSPIPFKVTNMDLAIPDSNNVTVSFYLGGNLLFSSDYFRPGSDLNIFYPTGVLFGALEPDYYDKLVISVGQDDFFLIDNFAATFNVPLPTSILLVGSGLLGLAGLRKKYKH
jgi:hypothetical protein